MDHIHLFSDASCNPSKNKSIGCYSLVSSLISNNQQLDIQVYEMNFASSTLAELTTIREALKYAHKQIGDNKVEITLYVDCLNFVNLINERKDKENLKTHRNYELYKELINLVSVHKTNIVWTKGHDKKEKKVEEYQKIFSILDKNARILSRDIL